MCECFVCSTLLIANGSAKDIGSGGERRHTKPAARTHFRAHSMMFIFKLIRLPRTRRARVISDSGYILILIFCSSVCSMLCV